MRNDIVLPVQIAEKLPRGSGYSLVDANDANIDTLGELTEVARRVNAHDRLMAILRESREWIDDHRVGVWDQEIDAWSDLIERITAALALVPEGDVNAYE